MYAISQTLTRRGVRRPANDTRGDRGDAAHAANDWCSDRHRVVSEVVLTLEHLGDLVNESARLGDKATLSTDGARNAVLIGLGDRG